MTKRPPARKADANDAGLRLAKARAYRQSARKEMDRLDAGERVDPAVSNMILAAIAYTDALTARFAGEINQKDHAAAVKLLRSALGNELPNDQANRLARILAHKDEVQYGMRFKSKAEAEAILKDLDKFADWAEGTLL